MWMLMASAVAKSLGLASQLALAWLLTRKEFGIYAIAVSLAVLLSVIRDGGLPMVLVHKSRRFDVFAGPVFWMMLAINTATGVAIAAIATPAARFYHEPELAAVISLFALTVSLCVPASILSLRLTTQLRFRELGVIQFISAIVRNVLLLFFAWSGFGARSFILPLLVTNLTDAAMLWHVTRYSPWRRPARFKLWPRLLRSGRWVLLGTFAIAFGNNGAYFLLGKALPSELVGTYFFAYQIVVQLDTLLSDNVFQILFPVFVRMGREVSRIRATLLRSLKVVMLMGATVSLFVAVIFQPLEQILWRGKWAAANGAVFVFAVTWPAVAGASVLRALQSATGQFREWGIVALITAMASILGTVSGALLGGTATSAAVGFAIGAVCGGAINFRVALAPIGINAAQALSEAVPPWVVVVTAAGLSAYAGSVAPSPLAHMALSTACFGIVCWTGARLFANESLQLVILSLRQLISSRQLRHAFRGS
jgi:O-antigen/teichoic acid export membrane protein